VVTHALLLSRESSFVRTGSELVCLSKMHKSKLCSAVILELQLMKSNSVVTVEVLWLAVVIYKMKVRCISMSLFIVSM